jgi:hypothetical protein
MLPGFWGFLLLTLLSSSCEKIITAPSSQESLPPITTEGKGTFACKVNGEVWRNCGGGAGIFGGGSLFGEYHDFYKIFQLLATRECEGFDGSMFIYTDVTNGIGSYQIKRFNRTNYNSECHDDPFNPYELLEGAENSVDIIKLDLEEYIVSGTFQCTLVHPDCKDTLYITEGRFDYDWAN